MRRARWPSTPYDLIEDPSRRAAMGRAASEMVRARYCAERIVPLYENAYEDVLRG